MHSHSCLLHFILWMPDRRRKSYIILKGHHHLKPVSTFELTSTWLCVRGSVLALTQRGEVSTSWQHGVRGGALRHLLDPALDLLCHQSLMRSRTSSFITWPAAFLTVGGKRSQLPQALPLCLATLSDSSGGALAPLPQQRVGTAQCQSKQHYRQTAGVPRWPCGSLCVLFNASALSPVKWAQ